MAVIDAALATFLEGPCAQNFAIADAGNVPTVGRAWGLRADRGRFVRAVLAADAGTNASLRSGGRIALMIIDLPTFRSVQLKGTVTAVEPPSDADHDVYDMYVTEFRAALDAEGRTTPLDGCRPAALVTVTIEVDAVFDQTPGPKAGQPLEPGR
jgi:hypothetical protein